MTTLVVPHRGIHSPFCFVANANIIVQVEPELHLDLSVDINNPD